MDFSEMELLHLRRLVVDGVEWSKNRVHRYQRYSRGDYAELYEQKAAFAESKLLCLEGILQKINDELARIELLKD